MDVLVAVLIKFAWNHDLGRDALNILPIKRRTASWFGHGCSHYRTQLIKDERNYGLGMDVLVVVLIKR